MVYLVIALVLFQASPDSVSQPSPAERPVALVTVDGVINSSSASHILRAVQKAKKMDAQALIIKLDTPGGRLKSTKKIVQALLLDDHLPVVVYVAPEGASAASAGTFITMAANIAAMAPSTVIGAASPVQLGGGEIDTVMQKKLFSYASSFIKSIAKQRGRNTQWAVSAVQQAESVTAQRAVKLNVVDFMAASTQELLDKLNGATAEGQTLHTRSVTVTKIGSASSSILLSIITSPLAVMILIMIAIWGIMGEIMNPGSVFPGIVGLAALTLVLYASSVMSLNATGYILIGVAIILFVAEAFTPTFGLFTIGGAIAFFFGFLILFNKLPETMDLFWIWIAGAAVLTALFFAFVGTAGLKAQFNDRPMGREGMIGRKAVVVDDIDAENGRVLIGDEYWKAVSEKPIVTGETVIVEQTDGLTLRVRPEEQVPER